MSKQLSSQVNTPLARAFQQIVTSGWANLSEGDVEAPTGHFALIHIEPNELAELTDAVFSDGDYPGPITDYVGSFLLEEDSYGNATLIEFSDLDAALESYNRLAREFALWGPACPKCGSEGIHTATVDNTFLCACGMIWNPTLGVEVNREDLPFDVRFQSVRHSFDFREGADPSKNLCGAQGGLQRDPSNTSCNDCREIIDELNEEYDGINFPQSESRPDEQFYLVCQNCGEAFDSIETANNHDGELDGEPCYDERHKPLYTLVPESEAF